MRFTKDKGKDKKSIGEVEGRVDAVAASEDGKESLHAPTGVVVDEVFGDLDGRGPNFRAVSVGRVLDK